MPITKIKSSNYLKGVDFTENLKYVTGRKSLSELGELLSIPQGSISTWNKRNTTSFESIVRLHLIYGIPVEVLALGQNAKKYKADKPTKPYKYMSGEPFINKIKEITGANTLLDLSEIFDIPKTTFSAWSMANRNSHELTVRLHLAKGVPVEELAFESGVKPERFDNWLAEQIGGGTPIIEKKPTQTTKALSNNQDHTDNLAEPSFHYRAEKLANPQHQTVIVQSFCLNNGKLLDTGEIPYALRMMNTWDLAAKNVIEVETNDGRYLVDISQNDAVSGSYLIDTNGRMSINTIQRLPNKLLVDFNGATIELSDDDIKVIGRIAVTIIKN